MAGREVQEKATVMMKEVVHLEIVRLLGDCSHLNKLNRLSKKLELNSTRLWQGTYW